MLSAMAEHNSPRINSSVTAIGSSPGNALAIVLTGVSGSGKSEVGREVAKRLGLNFLDALRISTPTPIRTRCIVALP
jgi:adenylylsulfate kinase-like enzyme